MRIKRVCTTEGKIKERARDRAKCGNERIKKIKVVGLVVPLLRHWHPPRPLAHSLIRPLARAFIWRTVERGIARWHVGARDPEDLRGRASEKSREERPTRDRGRLREKPKGRSRGFQRRSKRERPKIRGITPVDGKRCSGGAPS